MADLTIVQGLKPQQQGLANLMQGFQGGLALRDTLNQRKDAKLLNGILAMSSDDVQMTAARQSGRAGTLVPKIAEMQSARLKAEADRQKTQAEIGKIGAESGKLGTDAQKTEFEINQGRTKAVTEALGGLNALGNQVTKTAVLQQLMGLTNLGVLTPQQAMTEYDSLPDDPVLLQQYIQSKMPVPEQTTRRGQDMTQETALRGQDVSADTARFGQQQQNNRTQATIDGANSRTAATIEGQGQRLTQQQQNGQVIKGIDGFFVVDRSTGNAVPVTANGQPVSTPNRFAEKPEDRMERQINTNKAAQAAQGAARGAQTAADLMKHPGLSAGTGVTSLWGLVPGTEAIAFRTQLDNLKAQVFLPAVQQMKGLGALTNIEGDKVQASIESLDPNLDGPELKRRLARVAQQFAGLTEMARKEARILASRGGMIPQNAGQTQQQAAPAAQVTITRAQAESAAQQAGMSIEQAIEAYRAKGIEVR